MARRALNLGMIPNDRTGDKLRDAFKNVEDNTSELYQFFGGNNLTKLGARQSLGVPSVDEVTQEAKTKADKALADAKQYVDSNPIVKFVAVTATDNLNNIGVSGTYTALTSTIASIDRNYPVAESGALHVTKFGANGTLIQEYTTTSGKKFTRRYLTSWSSWVALSTEDEVNSAITASITPTALTISSDLNVLKIISGKYSAVNSTIASVDRGFPVAESGMLEVYKFGVNALTIQEYTTTSGKKYTRRYLTSWSSWTALATEEAVNASLNGALLSKDALSINKDKLYPIIALKRSGNDANFTIQALEKHILDLKVNGANPNCFYRISYFGNNSNLTTDPNKFGWILQEVSKDGFEENGGNIKALTSASTTQYEIIPNTGIVRFTLQSTVDAKISFDFTVDTTGFDQAVLYSQSGNTGAAWGHVIDPSKVALYQEVETELIAATATKALNKIPSRPEIHSLNAALVSISPSGIADYDNLLYAKDVNAAILPASITKTMSAIIAIESGMPLNSILTTSIADIVVGSGNNLADGDQITLLDALYNMMLPSSNTAANLVARSVGQWLQGDASTFISRMNEKCIELGMTGTTFKNPSGLAASGHKSTVIDLIKLGVHASKNPVMNSIWGLKSYDINVMGDNAKTLTVTSSIAPIINDDPWAIGGKTGTLAPTVYNMQLFVRLKNGYKGVAVTVNGPNAIARYEDMIEIVTYARDAYAYPAPSSITLI